MVEREDESHLPRFLVIGDVLEGGEGEMSDRGRPKAGLREDDEEGHVFMVRMREETVVVGKGGHHRGKEREPGSALSCEMGENSPHFCDEHVLSV